MRPTLRPGDGLIALRCRRLRPGQLRVFPHPWTSSRWLVKRVGEVFHGTVGATFEARSDNPAARGASDSHDFGQVSAAGSYRVVWIVSRDRAEYPTAEPLALTSSCVPTPAYRILSESTHCRVGRRTAHRSENTMDTGSRGAVEIAPFHSGGSLKGFVVSGRWPDSTKEWAQLLMVAVRVASLPGLLSTTTIFGVREELPDEPAPGTVGLVLAEGTVVGESAIAPGHFAHRQPPALLMLHPPSETMPSLPECVGAASGCVLLPGLPHLGLDHRAAWVEAESDGTITSMVSRVGVDPITHPDTAVLAMLLAA